VASLYRLEHHVLEQRHLQMVEFVPREMAAGENTGSDGFRPAGADPLERIQLYNLYLDPYQATVREEQRNRVALRARGKAAGKILMGDLNSVRVAEERFFLVPPHQRELDRDALRDIHSEEEHWERQCSLVQVPSKEQAHSFNHRSGGWSARLTRAYADFGFTK
jgi:hypothetical protein